MKTSSVPLQSLLMGRRKALDFETSLSQSVLLPDVPLWDFGSVDFAFECRAKAESFPGLNTLYEHGIFSVGFLVRHGSASALDFYVNGAVDGVSHAQFTSSPIPVGSEYHVVIQRKGTNAEGFLNGQPMTRALNLSGAATAIAITQGPSIGRSNHAAQFYDGIIDDVRLYRNRSFAASEALEHAAGVYKDETGLVGWWGFDEGSGSTAFDISGNGNNGTLQNGPAYVEGIGPDDSRQFRRAELWTFTLADGTVLRYTTLDINVKVGANTWSANGPVFQRPRSRLVAGVEVDEFEVTISPGPGDLLAGLPWPQAARRGALRGARLLIERVYMPGWGNVALGKLYVMGGILATVRGNGAQLLATIWSDLHLLNTKVPVDVVQPSCRHTLFDAGCTLSAAAFAIAGAVAAGSTGSTILATLGQASGWFSLGRIVFTSGANNGQSRQIKLHTSGSPASLALVVPLFAAPGIGDAFTVYPGCERTQVACGPAKFNNLVNFGAESYVPRPETAV